MQPSTRLRRQDEIFNVPNEIWLRILEHLPRRTDKARLGLALPHVRPLAQAACQHAEYCEALCLSWVQLSKNSPPKTQREASEAVRVIRQKLTDRWASTVQDLSISDAFDAWLPEESPPWEPFDLRDELVKILSHFPSLQCLKLESNVFYASASVAFSQLASLKILDLSGTNVNGSLLRAVARAPFQLEEFICRDGIVLQAGQRQLMSHMVCAHPRLILLDITVHLQYLVHPLLPATQGYDVLRPLAEVGHPKLQILRIDGHADLGFMTHFDTELFPSLLMLDVMTEGRMLARPWFPL